jgi:hypothetical protein
LLHLDVVLASDLLLGQLDQQVQEVEKSSLEVGIEGDNVEDSEEVVGLLEDLVEVLLGLVGLAVASRRSICRCHLCSKGKPGDKLERRMVNNSSSGAGHWSSDSNRSADLAPDVSIESSGKH